MTDRLRPRSSPYARRLSQPPSPPSTPPPRPAVSPDEKTLTLLNKFLEELTTDPQAVLKRRRPGQRVSTMNPLMAPDLDQVRLDQVTSLSEEVLARLLRDQILERLRHLCIDLSPNQKIALNNYMDFCAWAKEFQQHTSLVAHLSDTVQAKCDEIRNLRKTQLEVLFDHRVLSFLQTVFGRVSLRVGKNTEDELAKVYLDTYSKAAQQAERTVTRQKIGAQFTGMELTPVVHLQVARHPEFEDHALRQRHTSFSLAKAGTRASIKTLQALLEQVVREVEVS